jgi:hypothetical protein
MALNNSMTLTTSAISMAKRESSSEPKRKRSVPDVADGKRTTTSITIRPYTLGVFQRVAGLRAARGITEQTEAGIERAYSVSSLYREILEARIPELEAELNQAGIPLPEPPEADQG